VEYEIKMKETTIVKNEHKYDDNGDVAATGHSNKRLCYGRGTARYACE